MIESFSEIQEPSMYIGHRDPAMRINKRMRGKDGLAPGICLGCPV